MKIGFLPRAKDITDSEFSEPTPVFKKRMEGLDIPNKVLLVLFLCSIPTLILSLPLGLILIGVTLIISVLAVLSKKSSAHDFGDGYDMYGPSESSEASSLSIFLISSFIWLPGILLVLAGVYLFLKKYFNIELHIPIAQIILFLFAIFGLIILGMVIHTIGVFAANSRRRKKCTLLVKAEPCGYTATPGEADSYISYPMFKYHYKGRTYRFIAKDYLYCYTVSSNKSKDYEVFIDPDKPDVYYAEHLFGIEATESWRSQ